MTRRRRPLPPQPCSLTDEAGEHDPSKMTATTARGRITYFCPECGYTRTEKIRKEEETPEASETERPAADPEPKPRKEAPEEAPEETAEEAPKEAPEPKPKRGGRGVTEAFRDGGTITPESLGKEHPHTYTLHEVTICWPEKPKTFYEIYREDGERIGRISQAVSMKRAENLILRSVHPEKERYPAEGVTWTGMIRALREPKDRPPADPEPEPSKETPEASETAPKKDEKKPTPTLYVTIPAVIVKRYNVMIDDEVSVQVGDYRPDSGKEFYHVSEMSGSKVVILSKLRRMEDRGDAPPRMPEIGEYVTVRMKAETLIETDKRRNLCHWAEQELKEAREEGIEILHPSLTDDLKPKPPEPERKEKRTEPEPEEEPPAITIFQDF